MNLPCPSCQGKKRIYCHVNRGSASRNSWEWMTCYRCKGTGEIDTDQQRWIAQGEAMREDRKSRGLSLREEAARLHVSPQELSQAENGRIDPEDVLGVMRIAADALRMIAREGGQGR